MRIYSGRLETGAFNVRVSDEEGRGPAYPLPPQPELFKATPPPFRWGEDSPGTTHLAAALLVDLLGDDRRSLKAALPSLRRFLSRLPRDGFEISETIFWAFLHALGTTEGNGNGSPTASHAAQTLTPRTEHGVPQQV